MSNIDMICKMQKGKILENNISKYIRKKGIWILFGKGNGGYECLNVAKCVDVAYELLYDISCMQNLDYREGTKNYINEFGEISGLKYEEGIVQEYLYPYIQQQKYEELLFLNLSDKNDEKKEELLAWLTHAKYWRGLHRPFEKEKQNYYLENKTSKIGNRKACSLWNSECEIITFLQETNWEI